MCVELAVIASNSDYERKQVKDADVKDRKSVV